MVDHRVDHSGPNLIRDNGSPSCSFSSFSSSSSPPARLVRPRCPIYWSLMEVGDTLLCPVSILQRFGWRLRAKLSGSASRAELVFSEHCCVVGTASRRMGSPCLKVQSEWDTGADMDGKLIFRRQRPFRMESILQTSPSHSWFLVATSVKTTRFFY